MVEQVTEEKQKPGVIRRSVALRREDAFKFSQGLVEKHQKEHNVVLFQLGRKKTLVPNNI